MTTQIELTAIIITFNSVDHVAHSITSLDRALGHLDYEILVIDNASEDDTVSTATAVLTHGRVIENPSNLGYAKAANVGLRNARGRMTLVMNDDAELKDDAIDLLIGVHDSAEGIALVGPRIVGSDGMQTASARLFFPGLEEEWIRLRDLVTGQQTRTAYPADTEPMTVHWLIAACVLGETSLLRQVGGFNEEFFLYGEDIDLGRRLKQLGYRSVTVPEAICIHVGAVTTSKTFSSAARTARQVSGRSIYYRLWLSRWLRLLIYLRRAIGLKGQPHRLKLFLPLAVWDGHSLKDKRFPAPLKQINER